MFQDLDDLDEDALLGGSDDEANTASGGAAVTFADSTISKMVSSFHDEDVLQIDVNEPDDLEEYVSFPVPHKRNRFSPMLTNARQS
jgi:hypothetical protein